MRRRALAAFVTASAMLIMIGAMPVHAAATLVQQNNGGGSFASPPDSTGSPVVSVTLPNGVSSGDVIAVALDWAGSATSLPPPTGSFSPLPSQAVRGIAY